MGAERPTDAARPLDPGAVIGERYVILAAEGRAGDCLRYRAEESAPRAPRIILEYLPDGIAARAPDGCVAPRSDDAAARYSNDRERFASRAHRLIQLSHPALARTWAALEERGTVYAVASPPEGMTLDAWTRNCGRALSQDEIDGLLAPVLDALAALHAEGLLHLAITPDAIRISGDGRPVVTDLLVGSAARVPVGAAPYAAPELLAGQADEAGPRCDVYALAATLHAALTGAPPPAPVVLPGETWMPSPISVPGFRPELLQALATSLAPDPMRRPPSMVALKNLLLDMEAIAPTRQVEQTIAPTRETQQHVAPAGAETVAVQDRPPAWRVPWLAIVLLGGGLLAGLGYLGLRPALPPPGSGKSIDLEHGSRGGSKSYPAEQVVRPAAQRLAEATGREELLEIAAAEPAQRGAVEARLTQLGYRRYAGRDSSLWLRPDGGDSFRECSDCPPMQVVPAGSFAMGSPQVEPGRSDDEDDMAGPGGNAVAISITRPFAIGRHEVTRGQFAAFVQATGYQVEPGCFARELRRQLRPELSWIRPGFEQGDNHPVTCVSWRDAMRYVQWLSGITGASYRLPTEAEWEYAARGGSSARFAFGDNELDIRRYGNGADLTSREADPDWIVAPCRDGYRFTAPVGTFAANGFGLYDLHGNVWEWTADCQTDSLRGTSDRDAAPEVAVRRACTAETARMLRGGSWSDPPRRLRSAVRIAGPPDARDNIVGFRVVRDLEAR
ncbi:MAG: SUMF1/EgtB/PvdO family nonheme iron enzyme [Hyphomicrobiales bacterium]|nr:SUMF1/EgtB/PvdO family nonheme iron enzyme [Hyphomicrobiales bacterium]